MTITYVEVKASQTPMAVKEKAGAPEDEAIQLLL